MRYIFGPVLSRRLGLSMGVDLLPLKTCSMDCCYCEIGATTCLTMRRDRYVPEGAVIREISGVSDIDFDYLTFAGSGEPTLHSGLGEIIRAARKHIDRPIAVITNSSLLIDKHVREEVARADLVLPSLDAATQETFERINRPAAGLKIEDIIEGLRAFRSEFGGEIWLEVMLVRSINEVDAPMIARAAEEIEPDRIQLNTVVRPPAEPVLPLGRDEMLRMLRVFKGAELIPDWDWSVPEGEEERIAELLREPMTLEELQSESGLIYEDAVKYLKILEDSGRISRSIRDGKIYFQTC
ncbi:radical SAM protein [Methanothrix sp.]|uniref:radical SAM protein n=1 Tax=Methanothrix sp. TaxID=90426 RepID=UPI002BCDCAE6|nr:radical SAM protein [Methanothrix sp.]HOK58025.1 radical SAM protein [Methanothrix sp.]HOL43428.1 radical SAM protein [Methanothrix sp.]HPO88554.1 radical SAM protein [Methanothrix sp.]